MKYKIQDLLEKVIDNRGKTPPVSETGHILLEINSLVGSQKFPDYSVVKKKVSDDVYNSWFRSGHPMKNDILIPTVGTLDAIAVMDRDDCCIAQNIIAFRINKQICDPGFLYYTLCDKNTRKRLLGLDIGGVQPSIKVPHLKQLEVEIPGLHTQRRISKILSSIDEKITLNSRINDNLLKIAEEIFNDRFSSRIRGEKKIGDYISPKRGRALLSKDAKLGSVPVVAGGLEPATYHNVSNTSAPVVTISASGANAGYVNLWEIPVWSSDSSFIDTNATNMPYFWYIMLKTRQKEIYDAQTGSAQAHIYPRHIEEMSVGEIDEEEMVEYEETASPFFREIGKNVIENERLIKLRDTLLPELLNGKVDISNIDI